MVGEEGRRPWGRGRPDTFVVVDAALGSGDFGGFPMDVGAVASFVVDVVDAVVVVVIVVVMIVVSFMAQPSWLSGLPATASCGGACPRRPGRRARGRLQGAGGRTGTGVGVVGWNGRTNHPWRSSAGGGGGGSGGGGGREVLRRVFDLVVVRQGGRRPPGAAELVIFLGAPSLLQAVVFLAGVYGGVLAEVVVELVGGRGARAVMGGGD